MLDYPESAHFQTLEVKLAWGEWLATCRPWTWFATLTFREPVEKSTGYTRRGHAYTLRAIEAFMKQAAWRPCPGRPAQPQAVWAIEKHQNGSPHVHGLVTGLGRRLDLVDWGWENYGITRVEEVRDRGAGFYVAKYVLKGGPECLVLKYLT